MVTNKTIIQSGEVFKKKLQNKDNTNNTAPGRSFWQKDKDDQQYNNTKGRRIIRNTLICTRAKVLRKTTIQGWPPIQFFFSGRTTKVLPPYTNGLVGHANFFSFFFFSLLIA